MIVMAENESRILLHEGKNVSRLSSVRKYVLMEPMQLRDELGEKLKKLSSELRHLLFEELDLGDEEYARSRLVGELENSKTRRKELLNSLTEIGAIPEDATDKRTVKEIVDHTVSILRGETSLMDGEHRRGVDVLRLSFRKIGGPKERDSWASRGEMERAPLLVETSASLDDTTVRPYNLVTETVSRLVDGSKNDQEILEATVKRAIEEEVLEPLATQLDVKKSGKAVKELTKWLAEDPHFTTHFGKVGKSQSTGLLSVYNIHELTIYVPHPGNLKARDFSGLSKGARSLLEKLWDTKGIKRGKEKDKLVWTDMFTGSRSAPLYYLDAEKKIFLRLIKKIQDDREEDFRIKAESSPSLQKIGEQRLADDEWKDLVDDKHLVDGKKFDTTKISISNLGNYIEAYITTAGKSPSKGNLLDWAGLLSYLKVQSKSRKDALSLRTVKTCLSVREAVKSVKCNDCGAAKDKSCEEKEGSTFWDDSESLNNERYNNSIIRFKVHRKRLMDYIRITETGQGQINDALKDGVRYAKSRLESVTDAKLKPVKLEPGTKLHQITVKGGTGKRHILESSAASSAVWDPDPDKTNPSQNNGWWPPVHIDQPPSDMRKIAGAMRTTSYHFAVLHCGEGEALGLISCDDLESLADRLG